MVGKVYRPQQIRRRLRERAKSGIINISKAGRRETEKGKTYVYDEA